MNVKLLIEVIILKNDEKKLRQNNTFGLKMR